MAEAATEHYYDIIDNDLIESSFSYGPRSFLKLTVYRVDIILNILDYWNIFDV